MVKECALTTFDNPFDPFEQFTSWFLFDIEKGYYSCSYLAKIANTGDGLSDEMNDQIIEDAIDEIVKVNLLGLVTNYDINYEKVVG